MTRDLALKYVDSIRQHLSHSFGEQLLTLYLYGSLTQGTYQAGQSDINLLAVFSEEIRLSQFRATFRDIFQDYGHLLCRAPIVATLKSLKRHLRLNPIFARHLSAHGKRLFGRRLNLEPYPVRHTEIIAWLTQQSILASSALAPSLLPSKNARESLALVRSLSRKVFGEPVSAVEPATRIFARIQEYLAQEISYLPLPLWRDEPLPDAPPLLRDLRGIYEMESRLVMLLPDLGPKEQADRIMAINWEEVAKRAPQQYQGLRVTSPMQLRLVTAINSAADNYLHRYDHAWGHDPLENLRVPIWRVFQDLARFPSELHISTLPHRYISTSDSDLAMLIHDFQNKLLNIQLRNELLNRVGNYQVVSPPTPLPDREAHPDIRIEAIADHLDWWASYYVKALDNSKTANGTV